MVLFATNCCCFTRTKPDGPVHWRMLYHPLTRSERALVSTWAVCCIKIRVGNASQVLDHARTMLLLPPSLTTHAHEKRSTRGRRCRSFSAITGSSTATKHYTIFQHRFQPLTDAGGNIQLPGVSSSPPATPLRKQQRQWMRYQRRWCGKEREKMGAVQLERIRSRGRGWLPGPPPHTPPTAATWRSWIGRVAAWARMQHCVPRRPT